MRSQDLDLAASVPSNYRYYIGTGSRHTMWFFPKVYNDTTGGVPLLVDWVNAMLTGGPGWTNVEATNEGLLLPGDPQPANPPDTAVLPGRLQRAGHLRRLAERGVRGRSRHELIA